MKNTKKQITKAVLLSTVLAGGISLAQSFHNEAQATRPYLDIAKVYPGRMSETSGGFPYCICPQLDPQRTCFCYY